MARVSQVRRTSRCVEAATTPCLVHVRDSKRVAGPRLTLAPGAWADFLTYVSQS
ncbi:DUF397 domain-containing protein [Streptomyces sp. NPDC018610]|uniref:DUF397 domain-containing protein n=1 Tax=Streptomyces sp. NPDC018610 TaxID=3365049 RepID=UPI0037941705